MLSSFVSLFIFIAFFFGQVARFPILNGVVITFVDIGIFFIGIFVLVRFITKKQKKSVLLKPFLIFLLTALISFLYNSLVLGVMELSIAFLYLLRFIALFSVYLLVVTFSKKQKNQISLALFFSGVAIVVLGFLQFFFYSNLRNLWYLGWDDHLYRLFSVFFDPNFAGVMLVLFFVFLLFQITKNGLIEVITKSQVGYFFVSVATLFAIILTYSRTAYIMLFVSTVVFFITKKMYKILLLLCSIFLLFLFVSSDVRIEGLNPFRTVSTNARIESVRIATSIIEKNPIFGVGFNAYRFAQHRYGYRVGGAWETSHADSGTDNSFLFIFATTGIFGFVTYLFFIYSLFRLPVKDEYKPLLFATMTGLCVSALFLNTLFYPFVLLWLWALIATMENTSP